MKKLVMFSIVGVFCTLLLSGCGGTETLTCTNSTSQSGVKIDQTIAMKFNNDKVESITMTVDSKATSDAIKQNWSVFSDALKKQYPDKDEKGVKVTSKDDKDNYTYKITIDLDLKKADDDSLKEYDLDGIADTKSKMEDVKKEAEDAGFTCK